MWRQKVVYINSIVYSQRSQRIRFDLDERMQKCGKLGAMAIDDEKK